MSKWNTLADKSLIEKVIKNLERRGIDVILVKNQTEAKEKILELIPKSSRLLVNQSRTLEELGISNLLETSVNYSSVRKEYMALDHEKDADNIRKLRSTPDVIIGSVQAVTEDGQVMVASNTGSQLAAYVYGATKVIWVIGTQKIVKDLDEGNKRINDYVLPLESERLKKLYGVESNVSKLLIYSKEPSKGRITTIIINEALGF